MMPAQPISPCPFCGAGAALSRDLDGGHFVQCTRPTCGASTNLRYSTGEDARPLVIAQWNKRQNHEIDAARWRELIRQIDSDIEEDTDKVFGPIADSVFNGSNQLTTYIDSSIQERSNNG